MSSAKRNWVDVVVTLLLGIVIGIMAGFTFYLVHTPLHEGAETFALYAFALVPALLAVPVRAVLYRLPHHGNSIRYWLTGAVLLAAGLDWQLYPYANLPLIIILLVVGFGLDLRHR